MNAIVHPHLFHQPAMPSIRPGFTSAFIEPLAAAWREQRRRADERATLQVLATLSAETLRDIGLSHLAPAPTPRAVAFDLHLGFW